MKFKYNIVLASYQPKNNKQALEDSFISKGKRNELGKVLINKGIKDENVLKAIQSIPRHIFFEKEFQNHAYEDKAFPILKGQTISQPYTVAFQSELLKVEKGDKILEIGTGSGYQAAVLHFLGADVFSVEIVPELVDFSRERLAKLNITINQTMGDGSLGWEKHAPYDKIIVTAGAPSVPSPLVNQLKIGGFLVIPIGKAQNTQKMVRITRTATGITQEVLGNFSFVPFTGKLGW